MLLVNLLKHLSFSILIFFFPFKILFTVSDVPDPIAHQNPVQLREAHSSNGTTLTKTNSTPKFYSFGFFALIFVVGFI